MKKMKMTHKKEIAYALSLVTQLGWTFMVTIGMCFFIGRFIDDKLGTSPWMMFVFIILGVAAAFKSMFTLVQKGWKDEE